MGLSRKGSSLQSSYVPVRSAKQVLSLRDVGAVTLHRRPDSEAEQPQSEQGAGDSTDGGKSKL